MTNTPDFRALCAEFVEICKYDRIHTQTMELVDRADAALAISPKKRPTDDELMALAVTVFEDPFATDKDYAIAVLKMCDIS